VHGQVYLARDERLLDLLQEQALSADALEPPVRWW
jgi:hypothetical protein